MKRIYIFDTTLRDGEQSPGANISPKDKLAIAKQLEKLNVDIIEAGFPIASKGSFEAVESIAKEVKTPIICALARTAKEDIDTAWNAVKKAEKPRIHTFVATSKIHMDHKLKKSKEEILKMVEERVKYAKSFCSDIEFSPEDASRTDMDFMCMVIEQAVAAGATTINIPDTVGYAQPDEFGARFKHIIENVPNINGIVLSAHCHNDLGLAVANSLAAVMNGATQVEGTINGIGERAGNTALEELIMALKTRKEYYSAYTNINTKELFSTSQLISRLSGMEVQRNKAIIGRNAFAHESGIHQHGVLSNKSTYEIMSPEEVGWMGQNIVFGKLSGKHAVDSVLAQSGIVLDKAQLEKVTAKIKELSDKQKQIERDDVIAVAIDVANDLERESDLIKLDEFTVITGDKITPSSTIGLIIDGERRIGTGTGVGPVDAASNAIRSVVGSLARLKEYNLKAVTGGTDALASVSIKFEDEDKNIFVSEAVESDVIMASVKAIIKGANKALAFRRKRDQK